jgi:hypothetical protein
VSTGPASREKRYPSHDTANRQARFEPSEQLPTAVGDSWSSPLRLRLGGAPEEHQVTRPDARIVPLSVGAHDSYVRPGSTPSARQSCASCRIIGG